MHSPTQFYHRMPFSLKKLSMILKTSLAVVLHSIGLQNNMSSLTSVFTTYVIKCASLRSSTYNAKENSLRIRVTRHLSLTVEINARQTTSSESFKVGRNVSQTQISTKRILKKLKRFGLIKTV